MECQGGFESVAAMDPSISLCNGRVLQLSDIVEKIENPGDVLLKDFDIYFNDINDRLTISRMVSNSIIKGMICAIEQEATEKIARKDSELAKLKEMLQRYDGDASTTGPASYSVMCRKPKERKYERNSSSSDVLVEHDRVRESLGNLKIAAKDQLKKLKKEIDRVKGSSSIRRKGSGSELLGLSEILQETVPDKWVDVDRTLDTLRTTLDAVCKQADDMVHLSKSSLVEWQEERDFQAEVEEMVVKNCIWSFQEDFEQRLWDQNASYGSEIANWSHRIQEISSLRQELDAISKSLSVPESGQLISHGSLESRKASANHVSSTTSIWEGNGKHDGAITGMPENLDLAQLKHMSREDLANYFKIEMIKMKRHHESIVQEMTEENFSLRRELLKLKERWASLPVKKDKEFDILRKKIPQVILKLDDILLESEKLPTFNNNVDNLCNLKDRLESLHSENRQLRDLLSDKRKEIKSLSSLVSDGTEKLLQQSLVQENFLKMNADLKNTIEDAQIEASISGDLCSLLLKELLDEIKSYHDSDMVHDIVKGIYEVIFSEVAQNSVPTNEMGIEDSDIEPIIMQGLCGVIYREALTEAEEKFYNLNSTYSSDKLSLEMEAVEKDKELRFNIAEKEKLEQEVLLLTGKIDEKEMVLQEATCELVKENEKFVLASQELDSLRVQTSEQQAIISRSNKELQLIKDNLSDALAKIELYKKEIIELKEEIVFATKRLCETTEENGKLLTVSQEKQNTLMLFEAREKEYKKQMNFLIILVQGLSSAITSFECRVAEDINKTSLRLESIGSELNSLIQRANRLRNTGLLYKQRLERRSSDLQKAEAEVDLLGDEVDTLLGLLEKIYIALDHYSPILQHYPGIIEILKLVKKELSGESIKTV